MEYKILIKSEGSIMDNTTEAVCFGFIGLILIIIARFPNEFTRAIAIIQYLNQI
jgi:hypothetical protein